MTTSATYAIGEMQCRPTATDSYEYDAYGNHWTVDGSTPNNMLYQGEEWDPDLSLLYLRARYMNPLTGRFLSRDPEDGDLTNPATLHKYLYAGGDPINKKDPTGRDFVDVAVIDVNAAIRAGVQATLVAAGAVCVLNTAADLLQGLSTDMTAPIESITFGFCSAKVRRGCSCTAKCTWRVARVSTIKFHHNSEGAPGPCVRTRDSRTLFPPHPIPP